MATLKGSKQKKFGLLAEYDSAAAIFKACEKVRDAGYKRWDSYTPFPVHNLDRAMGLSPSVLPWIVLLAEAPAPLTAAPNPPRPTASAAPTDVALIVALSCASMRMSPVAAVTPASTFLTKAAMSLSTSL